MIRGLSAARGGGERREVISVEEATPGGDDYGEKVLFDSRGAGGVIIWMLLSRQKVLNGPVSMISWSLASLVPILADVFGSS